MRRRRPQNKRRKKRLAIGIIAEDASDVAVVNVLIGKLAKVPYSIRSFKGDGCGKILGKCYAWSQNLRDQGCKYLILVHDLDAANLVELRARLVAALNDSPIVSHVIVIPVREIEAWLLADHEAIGKAMNLKEPLTQIANPEAIQNPKEYLGRLIYTRSRHSRRYVNAVDNERIATLCAPNRLNRCPSFGPFRQFIADNI